MSDRKAKCFAAAFFVTFFILLAVGAPHWISFIVASIVFWGGVLATDDDPKK